MVAKIPLPNVRKFFIPDPGFVIAECDLAGADAQVVAWEANDTDLKAAFRAGLKIHIKNARDVFPEKTKDMTDAELKATDKSGGIYHDCKRIIHATNYGGSAKTISSIIKRPQSYVNEFQNRWFYLHPGIAEWHARIEQQLQGLQCWGPDCLAMSTRIGKCESCGRPLGRTVANRFGYRRVYFDRVDGLLPEALAWVPQSTVALNTSRSMLKLRRINWIQLLLQVHDSIIFQFPREHAQDESSLQLIRNALPVTIPYDDPLTIQWGFDFSEKSWGDI